MDRDPRPVVNIADARAQHTADSAAAQPLEGVSQTEWREAWIAVLHFALRVTGSKERADDIRQEAFLRLLTTRRWTADRQTSFLQHMILTASSILKHENKAEHRRANYEAQGGSVYKRERGAAAPSPEQDIVEHAELESSRAYAARVLAELRVKLREFPLALRIVDRVAHSQASGDDFETPAELAHHLGVPVDEVYRARARIKRHKDGVVAAVRGADLESDDGETQS